uniref:Uncharacterized protein n=1 Tax=Arundo donax TaxID=35708 RepID=A0A0A9D172_ARUDO
MIGFSPNLGDFFIKISIRATLFKASDKSGIIKRGNSIKGKKKLVSLQTNSCCNHHLAANKFDFLYSRKSHIPEAQFMICHQQSPFSLHTIANPKVVYFMPCEIVVQNTPFSMSDILKLTLLSPKTQLIRLFTIYHPCPFCLSQSQPVVSFAHGSQTVDPHP